MACDKKKHRRRQEKALTLEPIRDRDDVTAIACRTCGIPYRSVAVASSMAEYNRAQGHPVDEADDLATAVDMSLRVQFLRRLPHSHDIEQRVQDGANNLSASVRTVNAGVLGGSTLSSRSFISVK